MMTKKKRLLVIDSNSVIHRAYHALPPLTTKKGELANAIYGFLLVFLKTIRELQPDFITACFDFPAPTFRHKKFKEYKITRPPVPKKLYQQIPKIKEILKAFDVPIFEKEGFEADDLIGTISREFPKKQIFPEVETIIISGDLDTLQLVDKNTRVYLLRKGIKDTVLYNENLVKEKYRGLTPAKLVDFKALKGDPSDNIPGVLGIGEKTATMLLNKFRTLENLYKELEELSDKAKAIQPKLRETLLKHKEQAFLSRALAAVKEDVPIEFKFKKCRFGKYDKKKIVELFEELEFHSLIKRLPELEQKNKRNQNKQEEPIQKNLRLW